MAAGELLEVLRARQQSDGLSLRQLAGELGVSQPFLSMLYAGKRPLTPGIQRRIERYLLPKPSTTLTAALQGFVGKSRHKSARTRENASERLTPFVTYLAGQGVQNPLSVSREHIEGFLALMAQGRRGRPVSEGTAWTMRKEVKAFVNFVADTIAPDDWRNPVRKFHVGQPKVTIRPLSETQVRVLLGLADSQAPTEALKARNRAMLYILLDGALRISELLTATRYQLGEDAILRVVGKGGKEREVALSDTTLAAIADYQRLRTDTSPYLIVTEDGRPLTYDGVKSLFQRWRRAAPEAFQGVRLSPHTLRHTSATMRRIAGMSEGDLQTFLGHSTPAMTRHYSAFALSRAANVAARRTSPVEVLAARAVD